MKYPNEIVANHKTSLNPRRDFNWLGLCLAIFVAQACQVAFLSCSLQVNPLTKTSPTSNCLSSLHSTIFKANQFLIPQGVGVFYSLVMPCEFCNDFHTRSHNGGLLVDFSNLRQNCKFCSLLRKLVDHFAPSIENDYLKPFLRIDQQDDGVVDVEVAGNDPLKTFGSAVPSTLFYLYNPSSLYPFDVVQEPNIHVHSSFHS